MFCHRIPVVRGGESRQYHIPPVNMNDFCHGLQDVEVEVGVAGDGAVQAGLQKGCPLLLQNTGRAAAVVLTDPRNPRKHHLFESCTD